MANLPADDRLLRRVAELSAVMGEFFEIEVVPGWWFAEQSLLGNQRPIDLARTDEGWEQIKAVMARLVDGAFI